MADQVNKSSQSPEQRGFNDDSTHEYDGIKELNNPPPAWIIIIFLVTITFSLIYVVHYFGYPGNHMDQDSIYERQVAAANEKMKKNAENTSAGEKMSMDDILANGEEMFLKNGCVACHGQNGEGNSIGPNLTDSYWINGCSEEAVSTIIREGKPLKGMTPFGNKMSDQQIKNLSKYILVKLAGTNPENAKAPQGEECK